MIKIAAVIGSGVMGASIAAHLANAGLNKIYLFDIIPQELTLGEELKGITKESRVFRNRIAENGKAQLFKLRPSPLFAKANGDRIIPVNLADDLACIEETDLIIEAVVENMGIKQSIFSSLTPYLKPSTIVATNTSGLDIDALCSTMPEDCRSRFIGMHFFNPPRHMKLLELIPGGKTSAKTIATVKDFSERVLGKQTIVAKNTPAFIANRIGGNMITFAYQAFAIGYTAEEIDIVTGSLVGCPLGSLSLADVIGLDILAHDKQNTHEAYPWYYDMIDRKLLGNKTKCGFYKKEKTPEGTIRFMYNLGTQEYIPTTGLRLQPKSEEFSKCILEVIESDDRLGQLCWKLLKQYLVFSAEVAEEIASDVASVDAAMRLGYNFKLGPFELWDALGINYLSARIRKDGEALPPVVVKLLASGKESFYQNGAAYTFDSGTYKTAVAADDIIDASTLPVVEVFPVGKLKDLGDRVLCLELGGKNASIVDGTAELISRAVEVLEAGYDGMVITSSEKNFCTGANLNKFLTCYQNKNFNPIREDILKFQKAMVAMKYCMKPIVAAPFGKTLGGGAEICLHAHRICAHAELNMGLVETQAGLIPSGGGTKELLLRQLEMIPPYYNGDQASYMKKAFDTIFYAQVSDNAEDAREKGYLRKTDVYVMDERRLLSSAKRQVLRMMEDNFTGIARVEIKTTGEHGVAVLDRILFDQVKGNFISTFQWQLGKKLARVISCGDLPKNAMCNEAYFYRKELETFLALADSEDTQACIQRLLKK